VEDCCASVGGALYLASIARRVVPAIIDVVECLRRCSIIIMGAADVAIVAFALLLLLRPAAAAEFLLLLVG
jgi:hypothetical protein